MVQILRDDDVFTACTELGDHRFEADVRTYTSVEDGSDIVRMTVYYEETHLDGSFEVLPDGPREAVWDELFGSAEMQWYIEKQDVDVVRRGE